MAAALSLEPQAHALELVLSVSPDQLVLGRTTTARVVAEVTGDGADRVRSIRLVCSVGTVSAPRLVGARTWEATYRLPEQPYPQVALLLARAEGGGDEVYAAASARLLGRTEIAFRTDPGATVTVEVAGTTFGPERAGPDGVVRIPIVVGPGQASVVAHSVDVVGNRTERVVTLELPDYPRVAVLGPRAVVAGRPALVAAAAVDRSGAPAAPAELTVDRGELREASATAGPLLRLAELVPPTQVGAGELALRARAPERTGETGETGEAGAAAEATVAITPDRAEAIALRVDREALVPGSNQSVTVHAEVRDRYGNTHTGDEIALTVAGQPVLTRPSAGGSVEATLPAPPAEAGLGSLLVEARSRGLVGRRRIELIGGPAVLARIEAPTTAVADGRDAVGIRVLLVGETGLPASEVPNVRASSGRLRDLRREPDGWWRVDWVPRRATLWNAGAEVIEAARGPAAARARVELTPPVPWLTVAVSLGLRTNGGALVGPSGELELATRVGLRRGWLLINLHSGLYCARTSSRLSLGGDAGESELRFTDVPLSGGLGYGLRLHGRVGLDLMASGGALLAIVEERTTFRPNVGRLWVAPMIEGTADVTVALGPGELFARVGFGYAAAPEGSGLRGNLLGLFALFGYRVYIV